MTSIRKLQKRMLRWQRYNNKTGGGWAYDYPPGGERARLAWRAEHVRRYLPQGCMCGACHWDRTAGPHWAAIDAARAVTVTDWTEVDA